MFVSLFPHYYFIFRFPSLHDFITLLSSFRSCTFSRTFPLSLGGSGGVIKVSFTRSSLLRCHKSIGFLSLSFLCPLRHFFVIIWSSLRVKRCKGEKRSTETESMIEIEFTKNTRHKDTWNHLSPSSSSSRHGFFDELSYREQFLNSPRTGFFVRSWSSPSSSREKERGKNPRPKILHERDEHVHSFREQNSREHSRVQNTVQPSFFFV